MRIFGFAGWSGSGKTTLLENVIPRLAARGLSIALVKHAHHTFDVDVPGKDSHRLRRAGCREVLVTSRARWALMHELRGAPELSLDDAIGRLAPCDLILIEGYKAAPVPKLEVYRPAIGKPPLHPRDAHIIAIATDEPHSVARGATLPVLALDDYDAIATFVDERAAVHAVGR